MLTTKPPKPLLSVERTECDFKVNVTLNMHLLGFISSSIYTCVYLGII
jgi:hypothetical protein